jgi:hypothetical protein
MSRIGPETSGGEPVMTTGVTAAPAVEGTGRPEEMNAEAEHRRPLLSLAGVIRGEDVSTRNAIVGMIAGEEIRLERGLARAIVAEDQVEMRQAGAQVVLAAGDVSIQQGGAQAVVSNGSVRIERGGAGIAIGRRIDVGERALVVVGIAPSLNVGGGRVLLGPVAAVVVFGGFLAASLGVLRLAKRRRAIGGTRR